MLGFSWTQAGDAKGRYRHAMQAAAPAPCLLAHRDVLLLLALTVLVSTACLVNIASGWRPAESISLFLVQMACCVLVCPTLALAVRVPPSGFFGGYLASPRARLLTRCIYVAMAAETVVVCWFYL
jgi:hypothetical protein